MSQFWNVIRQLAEIEAMATSKKVITREEWEKKLNDVKIRKEDMNKLVMNFLVTEGYVEAAEKFRMESGTEPDIDLATITDRMAVKTAVQCGNVEDAIEKVNDLNPEILDTNPQLFFHLQQQRLIELIRNGKVEEALEFAQEELAPRGEENQSFLEELERTVALLAFEDVSNCPVRELLDISQRLKTASEVNAAILTSQSHEKGWWVCFFIMLLLGQENWNSSLWFISRMLIINCFIVKYMQSYGLILRIKFMMCKSARKTVVMRDVNSRQVLDTLMLQIAPRLNLA
uniref:Protein C20orf11 n=1 Tax=Rhizophora mucronata TaxID=61149 RepID=A0A2P2LFU1_RHIMU